MGQKTLKPMQVKDSDYADIEAQLRGLFYEIVFKPVMDVLSKKNVQARAVRKELKNAAEDVLVTALNSGRIQYADGVFVGDFNATVSKALKQLGAKFNSRSKSYTVAEDLVPEAVKYAAGLYNRTAQELHDEALKQLGQAELDLGNKVDFNPIDGSFMIGKTSKRWDSLYSDVLGVSEMTSQNQKKLKKLYADNLKPFIKKFSSESILELRKEIEANAKDGYRFNKLLQRIESRYGVSKSKAKFLARQETALFVSVATETRFAESGVTEYIWDTAGDARVRKDHKKLNTRKFKYADPPVVDDATGRRGNPGSDFNCRCDARPVLPDDFKKPSSKPERRNSDQEFSTNAAEVISKKLQEITR